MSRLTNRDIIEQWKLGESVDWRTLTSDEKKEWLLACLFYTGLPKGIIPAKNYTVDGREINNPVDFYCLLGQVFFGDKGYFGQDLDGLHDCFMDLKVSSETTLTIKHHEKLAKILNRKFESYFTSLTDIFKEQGLKIRLV